MQRVTCLDAEMRGQIRPKVTIRRHLVDWNRLLEATQERVEAILADKPRHSVYLNPAFTVTCSQPTAEFFAEIRKRQAEWCRRAGQTFPRRVRRRVSRWVGDGEPLRTKGERYFHRALCFTGVLLVYGVFVHQTQWRTFQHQWIPP